MGGIAGLRRFLERVNGLQEHIVDTDPDDTVRLLHKTIKKVSEDMLAFKFNTAISAMMVFVNHAEKAGLSAANYETFLRLLAPFAPHLAEELYVETGRSGSVHTAIWPTYDPELAKDKEITIGVQINGKMRGQVTLAPDATEVEAMVAVRADAGLADKINDAMIRKIIYVPGRIINFIITT
jgi:leucyl-tRNA synthetase